MVKNDSNDDSRERQHDSENGKVRRRLVFKEADPGEMLERIATYREYMNDLEAKLEQLKNETGGEATTMKGVTAFNEIGKALYRALNGVNDTLIKKQLGGDV